MEPTPPTPPRPARTRCARCARSTGWWPAAALVGGQPTAFTKLRSTYRHEADSAIGFQAFNDPAAMGSAAAFQRAAANVGYAFNWFYVNSTEAAYFNSGVNPVRPATADPNLPMKAEPAYEWAGWNPDTNDATYTPASSHPQSVNQDYYVSWNNKQAGTSARPTATSASARCTASTCSTARCKAAIAQREARPRRHSSRSWPRRR